MAIVEAPERASPLSASAVEMMRQDSSAVLKEELEGEPAESVGHNVSSR